MVSSIKHLDIFSFPLPLFHDSRKRNRARTGVQIHKQDNLSGMSQKLASCCQPPLALIKRRDASSTGVRSCDSVRASLLITLQRSYWRSHALFRQLAVSLKSFVCVSAAPSSVTQFQVVLQFSFEDFSFLFFFCLLHCL